MDSDDDNEIASSRESENDTDDDDNNSHSTNEDSDSDDDGFRGGKIRGENYDQLKQIQRKDRSEKTNRRRKAKKPAMYEANDLGETGNATLHAGLTQSSAQKTMKERVRRMNIPLEMRFKLKEEEKPVVKVTNKGGSKEITYIPKDSRSNKRYESADNNEPEEQPRSARKRRGVRELGFR